MYSQEAKFTEFPINLFNIANEESRELYISSIHYSNYVLLQIRFNGELDTTYEISQKGLRSVSFDRPLAGSLMMNDEQRSDDDEFDFTIDNLSDYQIVTKLGNSNDMKLPVICTQIVELYNKIILPKLHPDKKDDISKNKFIITLNSRIWGSNPNADSSTSSNVDFNRLVFLLKCIKSIYLS
ncbi:hypothetical protein TPHA_0E03100 [Tetrapisispora phaffii CBS 4417]|uniref:Proteasome chaperone 3 n=1 Tax=Tetrapisispora phaffii (strain ATCC 24235 / CBS 4417 / NBRC 1672 / NRRL Y-8282 / UCD 70-5) TaxID=1071381 RepID=G8BU22_TETPH|nr:hypothetical protein TPHA_0E03100 [Tetrapisispora phaffii CBS 4417]CCE63400.1 hypothetical protein TPHA_0E03100 [Tetrapisispora phaffii CBS 4417]